MNVDRSNLVKGNVVGHRGDSHHHEKHARHMASPPQTPLHNPGGKRDKTGKPTIWPAKATNGDDNADNPLKFSLKKLAAPAVVVGGILAVIYFMS